MGSTGNAAFLGLPEKVSVFGGLGLRLFGDVHYPLPGQLSLSLHRLLSVISRMEGRKSST